MGPATVSHLLEVIELLLQHLNLLQVGTDLLACQRCLLLMDPLLQLIGLTEQHELLAALLQHALALLTQFQQRVVSDRSQGVTGGEEDS